MEAIWRELRTLRVASSRITSSLSGSLSKVALRRVNRITSGQLQHFGPDCTSSSVYAISVESVSVGSDILCTSEQRLETISLIKQTLLDHDGDILDVSPSRVIACWMPAEHTKQSACARLAIQAALKVSTSIGDRIVCCVCHGNLNHAIAGGVSNQFVQFIYGDVLLQLHSGITLARTQGSRFMLSNAILTINHELSSVLSNVEVCGDFLSCSIPIDCVASLAHISSVNGSYSTPQDLTCSSQQWILSCIPFFSPDRKFIQENTFQTGSCFMSICIRLNLGSFLEQLNSQMASEFTESFEVVQRAIASIQRHCFGMQCELWRIVVHGTEAHVFLAHWFEPCCDFILIESMLCRIVHDLNTMGIHYSVGIDSNSASVVSFGPETRSTVFIQSESIHKSLSTSLSCPWNHLQTECPEIFPCIERTNLLRSGSDTFNLFTFAADLKVQYVAQLPIFFDRQEASTAFLQFLESISENPHQGVLAICGCFGSGKSHLLNSMQSSSDSKGIASLRCRPETRNCVPLAPFISILAQLLNIDLHSDPKETKLKICRSYVRTQMLADDRDVALLGVIFDFTLENDLLQGLTIAGILEELKSVMSRAFYALGSASSPFILFIENIHLLDSFSWDLLMDLASKKVSIVCEALDAYDSDEFSLEMKKFLSHNCVVKLPLNIVSLEVFESFLCQKCNCNRVKPEVVSYIRTQSGCRNLFSNELCNYMMKNHSISVIDNELAFSGEYCLSVNPVVPSSIQLLIESDIMRLSEAQQLFLKIVAILGRSFTLEDVTFLSRKSSSKPFPSSKRTSHKEAQDTYALCSRLCELGILRPDSESQEQFTVTYVAPSLLTAVGSTSDDVLSTQRAAGLSCDSVLFWCFQSHVVQSVVMGQLNDDQKKTISLKIATQCQYSSKALASHAQESAKSSFKIARHLYEAGNSIDALAVLHTLSPSSIYKFLRDNVFLCFPPPVSFQVSEEAYISSRLFHVPWIREFCRCIESVNPLRIRSASPIQRIASNGGPSSRSSSPAKTQGHVQVAHALETTHFYFQTHQGNQSNGIMELSTLSIKSSSDRLSRLTDPPKRLARCGGDSSRILFQHLYTFITHYPP
jgi:hypothetical protein